ncbi:MAG: hypothetical protein Q7K33_03505 [Candidatus Berkelbacteria bacterium]|nr:hypothetical protein [Candidatus Berkelbacteria bacterium]
MNQDQMPPSFDSEDYSGLPYAAIDYISKLAQMSPTDRQQLFNELATGKTDTLNSRFGSNGMLFFKATRRIEGYRGNGNPTASRLEALYNIAQRGDLEALYKFWSQPVIDGFVLKWVKDLPNRVENGRSYMGMLVTGSNWPATLHMEPALVLPKGTAIKKLPSSVPMQDWVKRSDGSHEIWVDVTDVKVPKGTKIYLMSSYEEPATKARRYIKPQPKLALATSSKDAPNVLFLEF